MAHTYLFVLFAAVLPPAHGSLFAFTTNTINHSATVLFCHLKTKRFPKTYKQKK